MEETELIDTVLVDWCSECVAVIKSNEPCEHSNLEWLGFVEW